MFADLVLPIVLSLNPRLTPGVVRPLSVHTICTTKWGLDRRHVTIAMKREVARRYGVKWSLRSRYEFDHRIPRELGGADDVDNLWPQPWPDARKKDREETRLHREVCAGRLTLEDAREQIRQWR